MFFVICRIESLFRPRVRNLSVRRKFNFYSIEHAVWILLLLLKHVTVKKLCLFRWKGSIMWYKDTHKWYFGRLSSDSEWIQVRNGLTLQHEPRWIYMLFSFICNNNLDKRTSWWHYLMSLFQQRLLSTTIKADHFSPMYTLSSCQLSTPTWYMIWIHNRCYSIHVSWWVEMTWCGSSQ